MMQNYIVKAITEQETYFIDMEGNYRQTFIFYRLQSIICTF